MKFEREADKVDAEADLSDGRGHRQPPGSGTGQNLHICCIRRTFFTYVDSPFKCLRLTDRRDSWIVKDCLTVTGRGYFRL